jgi:hypothetical protein
MARVRRRSEISSVSVRRRERKKETNDAKLPKLMLDRPIFKVQGVRIDEFHEGHGARTVVGAFSDRTCECRTEKKGRGKEGKERRRERDKRAERREQEQVSDEYDRRERKRENWGAPCASLCPSPFALFHSLLINPSSPANSSVFFPSLSF